jgi:hypothetical protein
MPPLDHPPAKMMGQYETCPHVNMQLLYKLVKSEIKKWSDF